MAARHSGCLVLAAATAQLGMEPAGWERDGRGRERGEKRDMNKVREMKKEKRQVTVGKIE